ncbi:MULTISPECIES: polyprenyl synthetase family protein [Streptomyces]|uniref:polyprenyl synthetase family protein n=1 Tax=Streptomyces TaxID=1883 RepID=UPI00136D8F23|nr:polyprenyl synthetase family protein [Streptomyces sp. SID2888]MYV46044.1 polyprenyl synthetase family protein [Streptomyces sp. SID2888]
MAEDTAPAVLKSRVDAVLRAFVDREVEQLLEIDPELALVAEQLRAATAHGKRLRAAFCYWGWRASGQPDGEGALRAAAAIELVHAAAVVHDDLIDRSRLRHGRPTAQWALRGRLVRRARPAAAAEALAMLAGDLLMAWAGQLFADCGLPGAFLSRARPLWAVLARELVAGECLEVLRTGAGPDTAASLQIVRYKTAKYTVEHPLLIGAALGGTPVGRRESLSAYGLPLGEAFQLRDDLLGLFGDPERTGKENADDLTARRPTVLLAETWRCATAAERAELRRLLGGVGQDAATVGRVREIMHRTRAPARVEQMIDERVRAATSALAGLWLPRQAEQALAELAEAATSRHR